MALMTYQQVIGRNADFAILLCFLTGCVQLLMAVLHLGMYCVLYLWHVQVTDVQNERGW
jgi:hypothetical protein